MKILLELTEKDTGAKVFARLSPEIKKMFGEACLGKWELQLRKPTRTIRQNNSLHLFLGWLAEALNESDNLLTLKYFGKEFEVKWTAESVKDRIWRPVQKVLTKKESSAKITTKELTEIAKTIQENLSKKLGIILEFPNELDRQLNISNYEIHN